MTTKLSPRQRQCIRMFGEGKQLKEIAQELGIAYHTVVAATVHAREKLGARTTGQAATMLLIQERDALAAALRHIHDVALVGEGRDLPGIYQTASEALAEVGG